MSCCFTEQHSSHCFLQFPVTIFTGINNTLPLSSWALITRYDWIMWASYCGKGMPWKQAFLQWGTRVLQSPSADPRDSSSPGSEVAAFEFLLSLLRLVSQGNFLTCSPGGFPVFMPKPGTFLAATFTFCFSPDCLELSCHGDLILSFPYLPFWALYSSLHPLFLPYLTHFIDCYLTSGSFPGTFIQTFLHPPSKETVLDP